VEETGINEHIMWHVANERIKRRNYCEIIPLKARGKKEDRILQLVHFYKNGRIFHNDAVGISGPLELQLVSFPRSKRFDVMDALAHVVTILNDMERYFWFHAGILGEDEELESFEVAAAKAEADEPALHYEQY
jgi:hypothetical protein